MRRYFFLVLLTVIFIAVIIASLCISQGNVVIIFGINNEQAQSQQFIKAWNQDGEHLYVFLPSYVNISDIFIVCPKTLKIAWGGVQISDGIDCTLLEVGKEYDIVIEQKARKLLFVQSDNVATMFIDTASGSMKTVHKDKKHKENATIILFDEDGCFDYSGSLFGQIRGHGNNYYNFEKKSYNLYFTDAYSLLNMHSSNKWVLISNDYDTTNLRNKIIYDYAKSIQGYEGFSPDCSFVDLYLNGEYQGLYLLCMHTSGIADNVIDKNISYFFETELTSRAESDLNSFEINPGITVQVAVPSVMTNQDCLFLGNYLRNMQEALLNENEFDKMWADYIDMDSWARKYLIEEVFLNYDAGAISQYYYICNDDNKIYAGPCWDYNNTIGLSAYQRIANSFPAQREWRSEGVYTPWYYSLWEKEEFRNYVKHLYVEEFLPYLTTLLESGISEDALTISKAALSNSIRWNSDWKTSVDYMKNFLTERVVFLNSAWIDRMELRTITLKYSSRLIQFFCLPSGTQCINLPTPEECYKLEGVTTWYYEGIDDPFDYNTIITEDIILYAKESEVESANIISIRLIVLVLSCAVIFFLFAALVITDWYRRRRGGKK